MEKNTVQPMTSSSGISWRQFSLGLSIVKFHSLLLVCVCVCVCVRERESEREIKCTLN